MAPPWAGTPAARYVTDVKAVTTSFMDIGASIRVGADVTAVRQVADSVSRFGARYLHRIYTDHEIASCAGCPEVAARALAARFAAKEATIKVLRPADQQPDWRSIEVRKDPAGWCRIALSGFAAQLGAQAGIVDLDVSLTHEDGMAAAVVIAVCGTAAVSPLESTPNPTERALSGGC
jgi:holo-[acyl-carrier protein] synthase